VPLTGPAIYSTSETRPVRAALAAPVDDERERRPGLLIPTRAAHSDGRPDTWLTAAWDDQAVLIGGEASDRVETLPNRPQR
jgi:hypothetical protein